MNKIKLFFKGFIVGIGGISPGLSGSVLMVILGLYAKVINAIATLFKNFKKNVIFLIPIVLGMMLGIVTFSRLIKYSIDNYEIQTRLAFLGLLIGTVPVFYKEVKKNENVKKRHYLMMTLSFILGLYFLTFSGSITGSENLNIFQAFMLGFVGISAAIVPGIDGNAILSALGLYGNWLDLTSLNNIDLALYVPAGIGVIAGAFILSGLINSMIKKRHTETFSVLFGFFLSIIPSILKSEAGDFISLGNNGATYIGMIFLVVGILCSYFFSKINREE